MQVGDGRGGHIGNAVGDSDPGQTLAGAENVSRLRPMAGVVAVRAAGGVAEERCTPVFI